MYKVLQNGVEIRKLQHRHQAPFQTRFFSFWVNQYNKSKDYEKALEFASISLVSNATKKFRFWARLAQLKQQQYEWGQMILRKMFKTWSSQTLALSMFSCKEKERTIFIGYVWRIWHHKHSRSKQFRMVKYASHSKIFRDCFHVWQKRMVTKTEEKNCIALTLKHKFLKWRLLSKYLLARRFENVNRVLLNFNRWLHATHDIQISKVRFLN
jgi:hypothetical protein